MRRQRAQKKQIERKVVIDKNFAVWSVLFGLTGFAFTMKFFESDGLLWPGYAFGTLFGWGNLYILEKVLTSLMNVQTNNPEPGSVARSKKALMALGFGKLLFLGLCLGLLFYTPQLEFNSFAIGYGMVLLALVVSALTSELFRPLART